MLDRLVQVGIEGLALRGDALQPLLLEHADQRVEEGLDLLDVVLARLVADVQDGQQLLDQRLGGPLEVVGLLLDHPLAVVLELGLKAAELVEVLVALGGWVAGRLGLAGASPTAPGSVSASP